MKSPLDFENTPTNKSKSITEDKPRKKSKGTSSFKNPIFKEIMPVGIYLGLTVAVIGGSLFYTNSYEPNYAFSNYSKSEQIDNSKAQIENQLKQKGSLQAELENSQNKLSSLSLSLEEQNMMKTPLTQGYYFISYFSYLTEKYNIELNELSVLASDGSSEIDLTTINDAIGTYDLLPIKVDMVTTTDNLRSLLDEMYTKRIIQVKNLSVINNLDSTSKVSFQVFFTDTEAIMQQQQQVDQAIGNVNVDVDPLTGEPITTPPVTEQPVAGQPVAPDGSLQQDGSNTNFDPNVNTGMEVNQGGNAEEQQQHYEETGEIIDPLTGQVIGE